MSDKKDKEKDILIPPSVIGLTKEEVESRVSEGLVNADAEDMSRSTKNIIFKNLFTLFNIVLVILAFSVMMTREFKNAIFFWVALVNSGIGIFQEIRAKKTIEKLSVLAKTSIFVVRNQKVVQIPHDQLVLDDVLYLTTGDQVPADSLVIHCVGLEVDESLLTGESDNIMKHKDSTLMSGSFITAGEAFVKVTAVGDENYSSRLMQEAKTEKKNPSELMRNLNRMVTILSILIVPIGIGFFIIQYNITNQNFRESILAVSSAIVNMIPEGLMLLTSVAFAVGAANLARKKTLVQSLPCIETLARVDTICLDKTGTITDGSLKFEECIIFDEEGQPLNGEKGDLLLEEVKESPLEETKETEEGSMDSIRNLFERSISNSEKTSTLEKEDLMTDEEKTTSNLEHFKTLEDEVKKYASEMMVSLPDSNATAKAIREFFVAKRPTLKCTNIIPFSSARKWSGVTFSNHGSYVVGAPEFIFSKVPLEVEEVSEKYVQRGLRVLAFVHFETEIEADEPLTEGKVLALFILSDTIRKNAKETFSYFEKQDVTLKVISGDNPVSVSNIALQAGIAHAEDYIDMSRVDEDTDFKKLVEENTVFGRVTPYQKRELVKALKAKGHTTCMTGDGVNDVLSLREADVGVAMASGSDAARSAADVVLLNSDFGMMVDVLKEGRRVINNIDRVASMYLVKTIYSFLLTFLCIILNSKYPFEPVQLAPVNTLTVGIPSFFLALKPSYERTRGNFLQNTLKVSLPAALSIVLGVIILQIADRSFGIGKPTATMCVLVIGCVGFQVLLKVAKPLDLKKKLLIGALFTAFIACFLFFQDFFNFSSLLDRNAFFYLPLVLGSNTIHNFFSFVIEKIIHYINKAVQYIKHLFKPGISEV